MWYLNRSLDSTDSLDEIQHVDLACSELERRLGRFEAARARLLRMKEAEYELNEALRRIVDLELQLVKEGNFQPQQIPE